jgi:hypothetical protein
MKTIIALAALFATTAFALETPAYWMKEYPGADPVKVDRCMKVANEAYDKNVSDTAWGQNGWAVLHKGNAWEKCMDGK